MNNKKDNSRIDLAIMNKILPRSKRSQHEIAGFVLIVLIVSIIGVVFISIAFAKGGVSSQSSIEVSNLLEASMYSTTNCAINYIPQYRDIQDLIKECFKDQTGNFRTCLGEEDVCEVLERDLKEIIDEGLVVGEQSPNRAYKLDIYFTYGDDVNPNEEILSLNNGIFSNCSAVVGGGHSISAGSFGFGSIETQLRVCKT